VPTLKVNRAASGSCHTIMAGERSLRNSETKPNSNLSIDRVFNPQTATTEEFVGICERADSKDTIRTKRYDSSSDDESPTRKTAKKHHTSDYKSKKSSHYCKEQHGPNMTHDSSECKVLNGNKREPNDWKKKDTSNSTYYKAKYKKKHRELNLLQNGDKKRESEVDESLQEAYKNR
jgi:hypothetical protein